MSWVALTQSYIPSKTATQQHNSNTLFISKFAACWSEYKIFFGFPFTILDELCNIRWVKSKHLSFLMSARLLIGIPDFKITVQKYSILKTISGYLRRECAGGIFCVFIIERRNALLCKRQRYVGVLSVLKCLIPLLYGYKGLVYRLISVARNYLVFEFDFFAIGISIASKIL